MGARTAYPKTVAIIGAGAFGAATAAAFAAEECFDVIRVFERRETAGGTWIYYSDPGKPKLRPGALPPDLDPRLSIPDESGPTTRHPKLQDRYLETAMYNSLTTNIPTVAMSWSDLPFPYGPFVPHWVPRQNIENYFTHHKIDSLLVLNTTVEDVSPSLKDSSGTESSSGWTLTLRRFDPVAQLDVWWKEEFDAVIITNGHLNIPYIPHVNGLEAYMEEHPDRVIHSKSYRTPTPYTAKKVLVIGNSASGYDIAKEMTQHASLPVYVSRRSPSRIDGKYPPKGIIWKPIVTFYSTHTNTIHFSDGTTLEDIDEVIYCTGYRVSFPFWNPTTNLQPLYSYKEGRLLSNYQHTFFASHPLSLGIVGMAQTINFRSYEYQAIALARVFSGRNAKPLPSSADQERWIVDRIERLKREGKGARSFHAEPVDTGETEEWFRTLYEIAGLPTFEGQGLTPPVWDADTRWQLKHVRKYPDPDQDEDHDDDDNDDDDNDDDDNDDNDDDDDGNDDDDDDNDDDDEEEDHVLDADTDADTLANRISQGKNKDAWQVVTNASLKDSFHFL